MRRKFIQETNEPSKGCISLALLGICGIFLGTEGSPFPETQQPQTISWFFSGPGSLQQHVQQDHHAFFPHLQQQQYYQSQMSNPVGVGNSGNCHQMNTPCSGHTQDSCLRYCGSVGFPHASCQGSCCLCSNTVLHYYATGRTQQQQQNQFLSMGQSQPRLEQHTQIETFADNHQEADLDVAESQHQPQNIFNQFNNLQQGKKKNEKILQSKWEWPTTWTTSKTANKFKWTTKTEKIEPKEPTKNVKDIHIKAPSYGQNKYINTTKLGTVKVCETEACLRAAKRLRFKMNRSVDPCSNFYEYACGGFTKNTVIPPDQTEVTTFTVLRNKVATQLRKLLEEPPLLEEAKPFKLAKTLYKSCMDTAHLNQLGTEPLVKDVLDQIGGWPVLDPPSQLQHWSPEFFTWSNYVVWFRELGISHDIFMKISVEPDIKNVKRRLFTIGEPILGLSREVLINGLSDPGVQAYYNYMVETAVLFGAFKSVAERDMMAVLNFEIALAKSFHRPNGSRASAYYVPTTIGEMEAKHTTIPWLELFQRILPTSVASSINSNEVVIISVPHFVDAFFNLIQTVDTRTIANYAVWRMISSSMTYLSASAKRLQFDFTTAITGQKQSVPRWKECTDMVAQSMGNAVGAMYIRRHFPPSAKAEAEQMVSNIHKSFLQILNEVEWMDPQTKSKAREKALGISIHVGYPEQHKSDGPITQLYSEYNFQPDNYFGNVRNLVKSANNGVFALLKKPIVKNDWIMHGKNAAVNAFYMPLDNAIQFPAAILQNPFFDSKRPRYMNYGAIGWVAGHEISHGFDDTGHQFDKDGNYENWWDPFTKQTYTTKTQCMINQYGKFQSKSGLRVNGVNSQGENIADNGGIKQAYRGYQSWVQKNGVESTLPGFEDLSANQLFWVSAASNWCSVHRPETLRTQILSGVHAPGEFRVKGTFANNKDFARDWSCPSGSDMNPINKCSVW